MDFTLPIGSVSHGTMRQQDLARAMADLMEKLPEEEGVDLIRELRMRADALDAYEDRMTDWQDNSDNCELMSEALEEATNLLQGYCPPYCYFGMHEGDGSDLGVWPDFTLIQEDVADGTIVQISDLADLDDPWTTRENPDYAMLVNDHGNVTLLRPKTEWVSAWEVV